MSADINESKDLVAISSGVNINIGTLNERTILTMLKAAKCANKKRVPVILDSVGYGASKLRVQAVDDMLKKVKFDLIKGNISEIKAMSNRSGFTKGVDALDVDKITKENLQSAINFSKDLSNKLNAIIAISGEIDLITDGKNVGLVYNGVKTMSSITGTGCMLSAILAAFLSICEDKFQATLAAFCMIGIAGERAELKILKQNTGNSSFRNYLIDEIYLMDSSDLTQRAKYEIL